MGLASPYKFESPPRKFVSITESNREEIESAKDHLQVFDASCPLVIFRYREWEGKLKKLVFCKDYITMKQLLFSFQDFEDFSNENRPFPYYLSQQFGNPEGIDLRALLVFGLLYCSSKKRIR